MARVGVDLDGCLYDFYTALVRWDHSKTGIERPLKPRRFHFGTDWGWSEADFLRNCREASDAGWLYAVGEPLPGSVETVRKLAKDNSIHIVTARTPEDFGEQTVDNTKHWLEYYHIPYDTLTFARDKTCVPTDFFIDDHGRNVDALRAAGTQAFMLDLFDLEDWPDHPHRITSWNEFFWNVQISGVLAA